MSFPGRGTIVTIVLATLTALTSVGGDNNIQIPQYDKNRAIVSGVGEDNNGQSPLFYNNRVCRNGARIVERDDMGNLKTDMTQISGFSFSKISETYDDAQTEVFNDICQGAERVGADVVVIDKVSGLGEVLHGDPLYSAAGRFYRSQSQDD